MALPALEIEITADPTAADVGLKKLGRSLDGLDKATRDYQTALANVNKAQQRGIITDKAASAAIREAERAYEEAARSAAKYSGAQVIARRSAVEMAGSMSRLTTVTRGGAGGIQNVGYQIQDFAVQVGAGTSASQALGQQLPQLLSGFGTLGVVMGTVAAIGIPLGAALLNVGDKAKSLDDILTDLDDAVDAFTAASQNAQRHITDLAEDYGVAADEARRLLEAQRDLAAFDVASALSSAVTKLTGQYGDLGAVSAEAFNQIANKSDLIRSKYAELQEAQASGDRERLNALTQEVIALGQLPDLISQVAEEYGTTRDNAQELLIAIRAMQTAEGPKAQAAAAADLAAQMLKSAGSMERLTEIGRADLYRALLAAGEQSAKIAGNTDESADNGERLQSAISAIDMSGLSGQAALLAANMGVAADEAERYNDALNDAAGIDTPSAGGGLSFGLPSVEGDITGTGFENLGFGNLNNRPPRTRIELPTPSGRTGSSGSSGGRAAQPDRIGALAQSLMTESELLENWRDESMTKLEDFNALELEALGGHAEAKLRLEEEYLERLKNLQKQEVDERFAVLQGSLGAVSSLFSSFASMQDAEGKKSFERQKKLRKAAAIVEGISAGVAAWRTGMEQGGLPLAALYAAASAAKTGAQIAAIDRQSYSGGNASSVSASASSAASAPPQPTQTVAINLQGDTFSRSSVEGLLEQIQSQLDRGGRLVFQ